MSDSEPKVTKKAATRKAAAKKKAVGKAADVAAGPAGERVLANIHESINEVVTKARAGGVPALLGAATVSLHQEIVNATTPVDAVNQFLHEVALNGLREYTFLVRDEVTQELYAVANGKMVLLENADGDGEG